MQAQDSTDLAYYDQFPKLEEVLNQFFKTNTIDVQRLGFIEFAKKPEGWYIQELNVNNWVEISNSTPIWSASKKKFLTVFASPEYIVDTGVDSIMNAYAIQNIMSRYNSKYFDIAPVFGYDGYEHDLFAILKKEKNLSAELLDIHARAYSQICDKIMLKLPSQIYGKRLDVYFNSLNPKDVPANVVKDYVFYAKKSIALFKELSERFPDYQTIVGNIKVKYWNEHVAKFYDLMQLQQSDLARQFLATDIYDDFLVKYGRNMLKGCDKDGILFTQGDLDTYVSLYVQHKFNFRKDVAIVNSSLIGLDYHIEYQRKINKLPITLPKNNYTNDIQYFVSLGNEVDTIRFDRFLNQVKTQPEQLKVNNGELLGTNSRLFGIHVRTPLNIAMRYGNTFKYNGVLYAKFRTGSASRAQIVTMDIIASNQFKRPIYFALGTNNLTQVFLDKYLRIEGWVMELVPRYGIDTDFSKLRENARSYEFSTPSKILTDKDQPNSAYIYSLYLIWQIGQQAQAYNDDDLMDYALNTLFQHFPYTSTDYLNYAPYFAQFSYVSERYQDADAIVLNRAKDLKTLLSRDNINPRITKTYQQEATYLKSIARQSQNPDFVQMIKDILE